mgnify:CR=1 FL=1
MTPEEQNQGNPEIGMQSDSLESAVSDNTGSEEFFSALDDQVNGGIQDNTEATQSQVSGSNTATRPIGQEATERIDYGSNNVQEQSNNSTDWQKRYADSSREAVKWRDAYKNVEGFVPVLNAMKKDSGLVDHVRDYLVNGGKPAKSIQEELNLGEDFMFDQQEAMTDPDSDSAKLMNSHVDKMVQQRMGQMLDTEKRKAMAINQARNKSQQEQEFKTRMNMDENQFKEFKAAAQKHVLTLDDVHYLLNKDKTAQNVAMSTKEDMMNQMKNVHNMPTSASGANSARVEKSEDREVFENILGFDQSVDNLFG